MMFLSLMITHIIAVPGKMADPSPAEWVRKQAAALLLLQLEGIAAGEILSVCRSVSQKDKELGMSSNTFSEMA